jgi:hypothetical protein
MHEPFGRDPGKADGGGEPNPSSTGEGVTPSNAESPPPEAEDPEVETISKSQAGVIWEAAKERAQQFEPLDVRQMALAMLSRVLQKHGYVRSSEVSAEAFPSVLAGVRNATRPD